MEIMIDRMPLLSYHPTLTSHKGRARSGFDARRLDTPPHED